MAEYKKIKIRKYFLLCNIFILFIFLWIVDCRLRTVYAAPCYGTDMPAAKKIDIGAQAHVIANRELKDNYGKVSSSQYFYQMSYGITDWFCLDGKIGIGDIMYKSVNTEKIKYTANFAGGYGFRVRMYKNDLQKIAIVGGFQHISVHPNKKEVNEVKNSVILDDWQGSVLASKTFGFLTPYIGTRLTRLDLIHNIKGGDRKRKKSDVDFGAVVGTDIHITKSSFINIESRFIEETSFNAGFTYKF